jgi:hypothetical protein
MPAGYGYSKGSGKKAKKSMKKAGKIKGSPSKWMLRKARSK